MKHLFLFIFALFIANYSGAQKMVSDLNIENNDDYSSFAMLDSAIMNYSVYFTGENHNFRTSNYKLQLKMLKYLYQKNGTRHLFLEFGVSRGWLVNNYVQTGDSTLFKVLEDYSYDEYALLYKGLMEFNKTLPEDKKIMVHGIDIERSYSTPIKVLSLLLPKNKKIPETIALNVETFIALAGKIDDEHVASDDEEDEGKSSYNYNYNGGRYNTDNTLKLFIDDYDSLKTEYQTWIGDNAPLFDAIIRGIKAEFEREKYQSVYAMQSFVYREKFLYESLLELVKKYPGEKFYGQFGRCHTPVTQQDKWCDFYFFNSLATRLNDSEEPELKNKVFSIGIYYPGSTSFEITASNNDNLAELFSLHEKEGLKLIKIEKNDSLFKGVNDKFQYLIINYEGFKAEDNSGISTYDYSSSEFEYGFQFPNLEGHFGYIMLNLEGLKNTFSTFGLPELKSPQMIYGGAFTFYEDWFLYGSVSAHFLPKTTNRYSDTAQISFSGSFFKGYFGYESTVSETFNITPRLGIGYGQLKFIQDFDEPVNDPLSGGGSIFDQSPVNSIKYMHNAFLIDPSIDIRFNIRYVAFGLNTGYQLDVSEKSWNSDFYTLGAGTPKTSMSGFYAVLTLSLFYSL